MLAIIVAAAISNKVFALICLVLMYGLFHRLTHTGTDFYIAMLLGFIISGAGIAYLDERRKGFRWFLLQIVAFIASIFLQSTTSIESRYLGLIILIPWIIQLILTTVIYKDKFGDIDLL